MFHAYTTCIIIIFFILYYGGSLILYYMSILPLSCLNSQLKEREKYAVETMKKKMDGKSNRIIRRVYFGRGSSGNAICSVITHHDELLFRFHRDLIQFIYIYNFPRILKSKLGITNRNIKLSQKPYKIKRKKLNNSAKFVLNSIERNRFVLKRSLYTSALVIINSIRFESFVGTIFNK